MLHPQTFVVRRIKAACLSAWSMHQTPSGCFPSRSISRAPPSSHDASHRLPPVCPLSASLAPALCRVKDSQSGHLSPSRTRGTVYGAHLATALRPGGFTPIAQTVIRHRSVCGRSTREAGRGRGADWSGNWSSCRCLQGSWNLLGLGPWIQPCRRITVVAFSKVHWRFSVTSVFKLDAQPVP